MTEQATYIPFDIKSLPEDSIDILNALNLPCYVRAIDILKAMRQAGYPNAGSFSIALTTSPTAQLTHAGILAPDGTFVIVPAFNDINAFAPPLRHLPNAPADYDDPHGHKWLVLPVSADTDVARDSIEHRNQLIRLALTTKPVDRPNMFLLRKKTLGQLGLHRGIFGLNVLFNHSSLEINQLQMMLAEEITSEYAKSMLLSPKSVFEMLASQIEKIKQVMEARDNGEWDSFWKGDNIAGFPKFIRELADLLPVTFQDWQIKKAIFTGLISSAEILEADWADDIEGVRNFLQLVYIFRQNTVKLLARHTNIDIPEYTLTDQQRKQLQNALRKIANLYERLETSIAINQPNDSLISI